MRHGPISVGLVLPQDESAVRAVQEALKKMSSMLDPRFVGRRGVHMMMPCVGTPSGLAAASCARSYGWELVAIGNLNRPNVLRANRVVGFSSSQHSIAFVIGSSNDTLVSIGDGLEAREAEKAFTAERPHASCTEIDGARILMSEFS